jgi:hypothetical protein
MICIEFNQVQSSPISKQILCSRAANESFAALLRFAAVYLSYDPNHMHLIPTVYGLQHKLRPIQQVNTTRI